jgi:hypothetical protein
VWKQHPLHNLVPSDGSKFFKGHQEGLVDVDVARWKLSYEIPVAIAGNPTKVANLADIEDIGISVHFRASDLHIVCEHICSVPFHKSVDISIHRFCKLLA